MEKFLRPDHFSIDPNSTYAHKTFLHWLRTFDNFIASLLNFVKSCSSQIHVYSIFFTKFLHKEFEIPPTLSWQAPQKRQAAN